MALGIMGANVIKPAQRNSGCGRQARVAAHVLDHCLSMSACFKHRPFGGAKTRDAMLAKAQRLEMRRVEWSMFVHGSYCTVSQQLPTDPQPGVVEVTNGMCVLRERRRIDLET